MKRALTLVAAGTVLVMAGAVTPVATFSQPVPAQPSLSTPATSCITLAGCNLEIQRLSARQVALNARLSNLEAENVKLAASLNQLQAGQAEMAKKYGDLHSMAESWRTLAYTLFFVYAGIQIFLGVLRTWGRRA